jgi:hypothetical protein
VLFVLKGEERSSLGFSKKTHETTSENFNSAIYIIFTTTNI